FPWSTPPVLQAETPSVGLPPPEARLQADENGARRVVVHVRSARGARVIGVLVPPDGTARVTRVEGHNIGEAGAATGWQVVRVEGVPDTGFDAELSAPVGVIELTVMDETPGVPPPSASVVAARPPNATTTQRGDVTVVSRRIRL